MADVCVNPSRGRYVQGCRCSACTAANNAYWHQREKDKAKESFGAKAPYFADAAPVRAHLTKLLASGYTKRGICRDYEIPRSTVRALLSEHHRTGEPIKRIKRETAEKILEIGTRTCFVHYVNDRADGVYDSLDDFCSATGRTKKTAQFMCTPSAKRGKSYIERVAY